MADLLTIVKLCETYKALGEDIQKELTAAIRDARSCNVRTLNMAKLTVADDRFLEAVRELAEDTRDVALMDEIEDVRLGIAQVRDFEEDNDADEAWIAEALRFAELRQWPQPDPITEDDVERLIALSEEDDHGPR
jgi:hypothetical protein